MEDTTPLLLIALTIVGFWLIGKILTRSYRKVHRDFEQKARGIKIADGLHVSHLSDDKIEEFVSLIREKKETELASFVAKYRPHVSELEEFLTALREQFHHAIPKGLEFASDNDKSRALATLKFDFQPKNLKFNTLSPADLRALIEYDHDKKRWLNRDFIDKFGGENFIENFKVYKLLCGDLPTTMHIGKDHEYRNQIMALVESGMALQGRKIHLRDRLNVLQFGQLKEMAKELKIDKVFKSRGEAANILAEIPGSAVLLAMIYSVDDIFLLKSEEMNGKAIAAEWSVMQAYARLLCRSLNETNLSVLII